MGFCNFVLHVVFFQEHDIGVWVSRAIPSGNGAKQGVQYSDQLAEINGRSSVHTTIDEVASNVSSNTCLTRDDRISAEVQKRFIRQKERSFHDH
jgi:hypothetical protein